MDCLPPRLFGEVCEKLEDWLPAYGQRKPSILASYPTAHSFHDVHDFLEDGPHNHQLTILQSRTFSQSHALGGDAACPQDAIQQLEDIAAIQAQRKPSFRTSSPLTLYHLDGHYVVV